MTPEMYGTLREMDNSIAFAADFQKAIEWARSRGERLTKWAAELRTGRRNQAEGVLCGLARLTDINNPNDEVGYCCLGVYYDLFATQGWWYPRFELEYRDGDLVESNVLIGWARTSNGIDGETHLSQQMMPTDVQGIFSGFNDDNGNTFDEIGAWIESRLVRREPPIGAVWYIGDDEEGSG